MQILNSLVIPVLLNCHSHILAASPASTIQTDVLAAKALKNLALYTASQAYNVPCTLNNAIKRREWGDLTADERTDYTSAVLCLMSKPSRYNNTEAPGARSRYDDFVATHMNQTLTIHGTANFLSWHRYFVWTYEQALRQECGYKGYQPYWNWGKWADDPLNSPIFDGSDTSMSGNGVFEDHNCTIALPSGLNCVPPGAGGGCIDSGPFKNMSVNLGPVSPTLEEPEVVASSSLFAHNPRCLKRDISSWVSSRGSTDQNSTDLINENNDIVSFQTSMQGDLITGSLSVHIAGHFTIGGDPGGDLFTSPGDPAFWLHHAQIDRTWWIWQNQDPAIRTSAIGGSVTLYNNPPSRNGTLADLIDLEVNAEPIETIKVMSTTGLLGGPLCYVYE